MMNRSIEEMKEEWAKHEVWKVWQFTKNLLAILSRNTFYVPGKEATHAQQTDATLSVRWRRYILTFTIGKRTDLENV